MKVHKKENFPQVKLAKCARGDQPNAFMSTMMQKLLINMHNFRFFLVTRKVVENKQKMWTHELLKSLGGRNLFEIYDLSNIKHQFQDFLKNNS